MKFNGYWTKEVNDQHRQMIKEKKTIDEIREFFGQELLHHHPKKKYTYTKSSLPGIVDGKINTNKWQKLDKETGLWSEV